LYRYSVSGVEGVEWNDSDSFTALHFHHYLQVTLHRAV